MVCTWQYFTPRNCQSIKSQSMKKMKLIPTLLWISCMNENYLATAIHFMLVHFGSVFNLLQRVYSTSSKMKEKVYLVGCRAPPQFFSHHPFATSALSKA